MTVAAAILLSLLHLPSLYETDGGVGSGFLGSALLLFLLVATIGVAWCKTRIGALIMILFVCAAFSYRQSTLMHRLRLQKIEVANIVSYVERFKIDNGEYPKTLSRYKFLHPELESYISYIPRAWNTPQYGIRFHPTHDDHIGHYYSPSNGYWYEDD